MAEKIRKLWERYQEELSYLFFGVCTTAVNYGVFLLFYTLWGDAGVLAENLIAFAAAVAFAYVTNKFVFHSRDWSGAVLVREISAFTGARLFSFGLEELGLYLAAHVLRLGAYALFGIDGILLSKIALSVLATVLNYFFSKFLIFKKTAP